MRFHTSITQPYIQIKCSTDALLKTSLKIFKFWWKFTKLIWTVRTGIFKTIISLITPRIVL